MTNQALEKLTETITPATLTPDHIKKYICPTADDQEIGMFLQLCKAQDLNPFIKEAYLIPFGNKKQMVTAYDVFLKRGEEHTGYEGHTTEFKDDNKTCVIKVYRKGYQVPITVEVWFEELSKDNAQWKKMPKTMLEKCGIAKAFRRAFPNKFKGLYILEELNEETADNSKSSYQDQFTMPASKKGKKTTAKKTEKQEQKENAVEGEFTENKPVEEKENTPYDEGTITGEGEKEVLEKEVLEKEVETKKETLSKNDLIKKVWGDLMSISKKDKDKAIKKLKKFSGKLGFETESVKSLEEDQLIELDEFLTDIMEDMDD